MKYMLINYVDPAREPKYGTPEFDTLIAGYGAVATALHTAGIPFSGDGLQGLHTATSVRVKGGKIETMDGPFAETKEYLGGFYVIDVPDLDAAVKYAAMIPAATHGTIEVRPVMVF